MNTMFSAAIITGSGGGDFVHSILVLIVVGIILGILLWLVSIIPVIPAIIKQVLTWIIYLCAALLLINFLLGIIGHPLISI